MADLELLAKSNHDGSFSASKAYELVEVGRLETISVAASRMGWSQGFSK